MQPMMEMLETQRTEVWSIYFTLKMQCMPYLFFRLLLYAKTCRLQQY